jgi:hypothetical protein
MKKLLASVLIMSAMISGCAKEKVSDLKADSQTQDISKLPEWVLIPEVKGGLAGVGIASPSKGGLKFQIPKAETDARANIAVAIQSEISRITKEALRESNVGDVNDVEQVFSQATKEVVKNLPMSGAKRTDIYQGSDGTLYIRMVLKNDDYSQYLANSQKIYEQRLKEADLSRENLDKSQVAVKELFDELEKERQN